ncbi:hypothetical protein MUN84_16830 [Hymenobacter sp. 5516J-16]|uniref:hypothetical protein n=1 Tax=Hymenobacter sp. 5516J-16 TaxID=2932253 RepID=UPI001FD1E582|nr:hypothetical protein [Hymenobacter sp. 5516J-16]UOQ76233.1 hypothetical protein MUN84_16830 [Hymenobacter sp. 5516J-16]
MKYFLLAALLCSSFAVCAQKPKFTIQGITLPAEIADRNNQFSGLYRHNNHLLLLSESRLQERAEAKVYALDLGSINAQLAKETQALTYKKYALLNLDKIRARLDSAGQVYEGLEGLTMVGEVAYFSIETATPSPYCYLIKGELHDAAATITLDTRYLVPLPKPALTNGTHIYNAGFEALASYDKNLLLLYEYNYFTHDNYAFTLPAAAATPDIPQYVPLRRLPFRVTDLVHEGKNRFTAINYFYSGNDDSVYRTPAPDPNARFIQAGLVTRTIADSLACATNTTSCAGNRCLSCPRSTKPITGRAWPLTRVDIS